MLQYGSKLLDHFRHPRNVGSFDTAAAGIGTGTAGSPAEGDVIRLQIRVVPDGVIAEARFKCHGCAAAIAAGSLVTEWLVGRRLEEALAIGNEAIAAALALPAQRIHCSLLAEEAIRAAIADYRSRH